MTKLRKIQNAIIDFDADAIMLTSPVNRRYATNFLSSAGIVLITTDEAWFLTDSRYIEAAESKINGFTIELVDSNRKYSDRINSIINDREIKILGIEDEAMFYSEYKTYEEKLKTKLIPAQKLIDGLREIKDSTEQEKLYKAQKLSETAYLQVLKLIHSGMTERELAAELIYQMLKLGADDVSFPPIVVSAEKTSMPHGTPGDIKLVSGSFITMDFGCLLDGYCSDTTRTIALGDVTAEMKKVYDIVLRAQLAGIATAKAGVSGSYVDAAARQIIEEEGYGNFFGHGFGHGLGMQVHEAPTASKTSTNILSAGTVISAEPGIYIPGKFGVRIEDVIVIDENGSRNLTEIPKELVIL